LAELLGLVFHYDAREILARVDSHAVLSRYGAREVLRELALLLLEGGSVTSDRFKEIVNHLKTKLAIRGRELFHPIRLALAGRAGEGELDRVILRSEEHTSELQSRFDLVCRLLLEKRKSERDHGHGRWFVCR